MESDNPWPAPTPSPAKRVLVVEDDRDIRELLVELLESEGYQVSSAENGAQALLKAKVGRPHLILLDLMMPIMNGWQFREQQVKEPAISKVPVVVISAFANDLQVAGCLRKPVRIEDVLDAVHQHAA